MADKNLILPYEAYKKEAKPLLEEHSTEDTHIDYKHSSIYFTKEGEISALNIESGVLITIPEEHPLFKNLDKLSIK